jgi:hypothetical protein
MRLDQYNDANTRGAHLSRAISLVVALQSRPEYGWSVPDLAGELECTPRTVYRWLNAGLGSLAIQRLTGDQGPRYRLFRVAS